MTTTTNVGIAVCPDWCAVAEMGFAHGSQTDACLSGIELAKLPAAPPCPLWCDWSEDGHSWVVVRRGHAGGVEVYKQCEHTILDDGSYRIEQMRFESRSFNAAGECTSQNVDSDGWSIGEEDFTEAQMRAIGLALVAGTSPDVEAVAVPVVVERKPWTPLFSPPRPPSGPPPMVDKGVTDHAYVCPDRGSACDRCGYADRKHLYTGTHKMRRLEHIREGDPVGWSMQLAEGLETLTELFLKGQLTELQETGLSLASMFIIDPDDNLSAEDVR